ncbi:MAG: hypothetical protein H0U55_11720 [Rubrobacteraceae bacterium]|nr:hypothetical protein [Rubrobacteraceae bacterium]
MVTREHFAIHLLDAVGAPASKRNLYALVSWMQAEGSRARFNPLATTLPWPGATNFNSVGVKNYPALVDGIAATARTLNYGADRDLYGYEAIRSRMRRNFRPGRTLRAVESSEWGTGGLALDCLPAIKSHWDYYRSLEITS